MNITSEDEALLELFEKDGVLSQQTDQHNQRNLHVDIVRVTERIMVHPLL